MQYKNEAEIHTTTQTTTADIAKSDSAKSPASCTSSTDSGIIMMDNCGIPGNDNNDNDYTKDSQPNEQPTYPYNNNKIQTNNNINIENIVNINKSHSPTPSAEKRPQNSRSSKPTNSPRHSPTANSSRHCSPTVSIRSTTISIVSIDENAIDSSIIDSDSEVEADAEGVHSNYVVKKLGQQMTYPPNSHDLPDFNKGFQVVSQQISPSAPPGVAGVGPLAEQVLNGGLALTPHSTAAGASSPQIGSIALTNSTDVTFGDKHFYEGPVTIQQFLIDGRDKWKGTPPDGDGHDNPTFAHENGVNHASKAGGDSAHHPQEPQQEKPFGFILNRKAIITTSIIVFLTVFIAVIIFTATDLLNAPLTQSKLIGDGDDSRKNIPINSTIAKDNIGGGRVLRVLPRDAWLAEPPQSPPISLELPAKRIIVLPTQTDDCTTQAACTYRVRYIQTYNIESLRHDDIIYNFLIGGDGSVYEGRGWEHKGAHLKGFNDDSISFAFIGTFRKQPPAAKQMNVTSLLIAEGLRLGKLATDYKMYGAKLLEPSAPSADALYASFKGWPHWVEAY